MKKRIKKVKKENKFSYKKFFNDYKWLHVVLICILALIVISTFIMIVIFSKGFQDFTLLHDFGGWTSLISGPRVFIDSTFLALIVFYNTWQKQGKDYELKNFIKTFCFNKNGRYKN